MSNAHSPLHFPSKSTPPPSPRLSQTASSSVLRSIPPYTSTSQSRLQFLYSDISCQKHSNPASYHSNIEWWHTALTNIVSSGSQAASHDGGMSSSSSRLVLSAGRPLLERLRVEGVGKPLALGSIITELCLAKSFIALPEFISAKQSIYDPGWLPGRIASYVIEKPLWWALEQLGIVGEDGILPVGGSGIRGGGGRGGTGYKDTGWWGEYVVVSLVEKAADEVVDRQRAMRGGAGAEGGLFSFDGFRRNFGAVLGGGEDVILGERDGKVLLKYLERDRKVVVVHEEVIKFVDKDAPPDARLITAVDRGLLELKNAVENMHAQVDGIHRKIDETTQKASAALRQNRKPVALSYLRSRKLLEDLLTKRLGSLDTLDSTLIRVEAAAGDIEILKSYESSTATLRAILSHPSLQRDKIDATMDAMAEAGADAREVDEAIRMGGEGVVGVDVDEEELEKELDRMVKESEAEAAKEKETKKVEEMKEKLEGVGMWVPNTSMVVDAVGEQQRETVPAS